MHTDRSRWNQKFAKDQIAGQRPSSLLQAHYALTTGNIALDIAAGLGRNAEFLAEQGFQVLALDISDTAAKQLGTLGLPGIQPVQIDLDLFRPPAERFDLIVNCKFLDRRLSPYLQESLRPGGVLIFESSLKCALPEVDQPGNPDFLLRPNELLHLFLGLQVVYYEEALITDELSGNKTNLARLVALKQEKAL